MLYQLSYASPNSVRETPPADTKRLAQNITASLDFTIAHTHQQTRVPQYHEAQPE